MRRVKGERDGLHTVKRGKVNWRNCLLKHVIEGTKMKMYAATG